MGSGYWTGKGEIGVSVPPEFPIQLARMCLILIFPEQHITASWFYYYAETYASSSSDIDSIKDTT